MPRLTRRRSPNIQSYWWSESLSFEPEQVFMTEASNGSRSLRTKWLLAAVAIATLVGVFASMATSLAIRDLKASQHQVIDQLKALQETVSSNRAEMKRLSDEVAALKTLQQMPPPAPSAPAPTGQKRGTR